MENLRRSLQGFPHWAQQPIPNFSLSAGGLIALADLSTVAKRTAIAGGSSWLDSLLLAPGLHYQQAADTISGGGGPSGSGAITAIETDKDGRRVTHAVNNAATIEYIRSISRPGEMVTIDVGMLPRAARRGFRRQTIGQRATVWTETKAPDLGWLSELLYLLSPLLTIVALVLMVLLQDWWGLGLLCALMLSRILNIWVIKQRSAPPKPRPVPPNPPPPPRHHHPGHDDQGGPDRRPYHSHSHPLSSSSDLTSTSAATTSSSALSAPGTPPRLTSLLVELPDGRSVSLRGMSDDLQAITAGAWLRSKTHVEGYLEAAAKLLVFLVAAFSGNQTQAGAIVMMALLLCSAGLLALSNAHAKGVRMNGRVVSPYAEMPPQPPRPRMGRGGGGGKGVFVSGGGGGGGGGGGAGAKRVDPSYPVEARGGEDAGSWIESASDGMDDWAEKGQAGGQVAPSHDLPAGQHHIDES
ncbi:uncharacterized protein E0L32_008479 [Thyridium curvatum]|uniref:Uncharacterized protein n=1 Tax=Thyridium curvatum TaxID=1093900 RepID=A0A507AS09_9PEZI|nr:uncharacterized protein E0L32_008479 [Thyridium curvatum]TPX10593.1 hypothetical protein E0L32_008479 [Thyridium curvatum]